MREGIVRPLGLVTQPNKLGQYPAGALSQALGVVIRSPGLLTRVPQLVSYNASPFIQSEPVTPHLLGASDSKFFHVSRHNSDSAWEIAFFDGASKFGNVADSSTLPYQPITFSTVGRINFTRSRDRYLFNSNAGILIVDSANPTSNAQAQHRMAGFPPPYLRSSIVSGGALPATSQCSCRAIITRKFADNYLLISAASSAAQAANTTGSAGNIQHSVRWQQVAQVVAGDVIEVYRTRSQPFTGSSGTNTGAVFYLSSTHVITASEEGNFVAVFTDTAPDTNLGRELYTNPGQSTDNGSKFPPGLANWLATFKGYTFYGGRTDTAQIVVSVPGGVGNVGLSTGYVRSINIGTRGFAGTFANGSNVVTAISAAQIAGLAVGQVVDESLFLPGPSFTATITAVGASTITLSVSANANGTSTSTLAYDVIELNGTVFRIDDYPSFITNMALNAVTDYAVVAPELVIPGAGLFTTTTTPIAMAISRARVGGGSFTIRASNGQNYVPVLPTMSQTAQTVSPTVVPNGIGWSEEQQPEACPPLNTDFVGSGTTYGGWPTRDALWIFASDGLWRLSGTGGAAGRGFDWRVDPVDSTLSLGAPHAACVLRDTVYAYTNRGLVAINDQGIDELSQGVINDLLPGPPFVATTSIQVAANETDDEIWLGIVTGGNMTYYVYNTLTKAWTTSLGGNGGQTDMVPCYSRFLQGMASIDQNDSWSQSATLYSPCTVDYQPLSTEDPFELQQWIDATLVAAAADAGKSVTPRFNGVAYTARTLTSQNQDARTTFGVPRNAPAVANSIAPGFSMTGTQPLSLYGLSLRAEPLTDQRKQR